MRKTITPYDLGDFQTVESCQKIEIDQLVSIAQKTLKKRLVEAQIEVFGIVVNLTESNTRFGGTRLWLECPQCQKRVGTILKDMVTSMVGCRTCLQLTYQKQRYHKMVESGIY